MRKRNYDKFPSTQTDGMAIVGWDKIITTLEEQWGEEPVWAIDLYCGTYEEDVISAFAKTGRKIIDTRTLMRTEEEIRQLTERFMTDDVLFGYMSNIQLSEYFDSSKVQEFQKKRDQESCIIIGTGAACFVSENTPLAYADMARWEIQQRFRRHEVKALGIDNSQEEPSRQYKRGYFNDWVICDRHKDELMQAHRIQYWIDSNNRMMPKMISDQQFRQGMERTAHKPFRVRRSTTDGVSIVCLKKTAFTWTSTACWWSSPPRMLCSPTAGSCWANKSGPALARSFPSASISSTPWGAAI